MDHVGRTVRRAVKCAGRHPVLTLWVGLQVDLFLYWLLGWRTTSWGVYDAAGCAAILNFPGAWIVYWVHARVRELLGGQPFRNGDVAADFAFLAWWIASAAVTYWFWAIAVMSWLRRPDAKPLIPNR